MMAPHLRHSLYLLLALTLSSCIKAREKKEDLGPPVASEKINDALLGATNGATLDTLAVGQSLSFSTTRRVENGDSEITLGARKIDVIDRQDTNDEKRFTLRISKSRRLDDGSFDSTVTEDALWIPKAQATATGLLAPSGSLTAESLAQSVAAEDSSPPERVTFHHLRESNGVMDPPTRVKARSDCGGLNPCELRVHYVQFDMVLWANDSDYQKISIDFAFTDRVPYLPYGKDFDQLTGALIVDCRSTYVPVNDRTVYVRDCSTLNDFQK